MFFFAMRNVKVSYNCGDVYTISDNITILQNTKF